MEAVISGRPSIIVIGVVAVLAVVVAAAWHVSRLGRLALLVAFFFAGFGGLAAEFALIQFDGMLFSLPAGSDAIDLES